MKKILILGHGYVGGYLYDRLKKDNNVTIVRREFFDYTNVKEINKWLDKEEWDYVVNCSGFTGRPNVDQGEKEPELCFELNTFAPLRLSTICQTKNINYIHISSGCIFTEYLKPWTEKDEPNFGLFNKESSTYSKSKHAYELGSQHGLIIRVRMPFCDTLSERSYITKILKYNNLINLTNSKTYIPQLLDFIEHFIESGYDAKEKEIVNFVHPKPLATDKFTKLMKEYKLENHKWKWTRFENLNCLANRSNCVLSVSKLKEKYKFNILDEETVVHTALNNITFNESG
jgi:dTDP-4-dehydrorhamnose reductase